MIWVLIMVLQVLLGWLFADLLSGFFHWLIDRIGRPEWPLVGRLIVVPNRLHHADPAAFTRQSFWSRNWAAALVSIVIGAGLAAVFGVTPFLVAAIVAGALANEVHCYAHRPDMASAWVPLLQRIGLLSPPAHHAFHHVAPNRTHYCVLSAWVNPALDRVRFWSAIEKAVPSRWLA